MSGGSTECTVRDDGIRSICPVVPSSSLPLQGMFCKSGKPIGGICPAGLL